MPQSAAQDIVGVGSTLFNSGVTTRGGNDASGNQVIPHGLAVTPTYVKITVTYAAGAASGGGITESFGAYVSSSTTTAGVYNGTDAGADSLAGNSTSDVISLINGAGTAVGQSAVIASVDTANITLTWTNSGGIGTQTMHILWEVFAENQGTISGSNDGKFVGVGLAEDKNYVSMQLPFGATNKDGDDFWFTSGVEANSYYIWTSSLPKYLINPAGGSGGAQFPNGASIRDFQTAKEFIIEFEAVIGTDATPQGFFMGLAEYNQSTLPEVGGNVLSVGFAKDSSNLWYIRGADGAAETNTSITPPANGTHLFRIEYDPANTSARYYVDGTLVGTVTTNLPTGSGANIGIMYQNKAGEVGLNAVYAPTVAFEV